jgi:dTMP kinase
MKALFVVLEGIDGAGTTTQTARLVDALSRHGAVAHGTHEPSDGSIGRVLRGMLTHRTAVRAESPRAAAAQLGLLFAADRLDHLGAEVVPRLARGEWVVSDRYDYSSVAYQSSTSGGAISIEWLRAINGQARRPDLTIVLDVTPEIARARRLARDGARELFDDDALQRTLAAFYRDIERHFPEDRVLHVDADRDADEVFADLWAATLAATRA